MLGLGAPQASQPQLQGPVQVPVGWQLGQAVEVDGAHDSSGEFRCSYSTGKVVSIQGEEVEVEYDEVRAGLFPRGVQVLTTPVPELFWPNFSRYTVLAALWIGVGVTPRGVLASSGWVADPDLTGDSAVCTQFVTEEGQKLKEKFAASDPHLRPALPRVLYPHTLDRYSVREGSSVCWILQAAANLCVCVCVFSAC